MYLTRKRSFATSVFLLASMFPLSAWAQTIVWTDGNGAKIQRKDTTGGSVTTIKQFTLPTAASRIHYDPIGRKLYYWVTTGGGPSYFERCNIDGSAAETIFTPSASNFSINVESRKLHWIELPSTVHRAALNGSAIESHTFAGVVRAIDAMGDDLYFMATTSQHKAVWHSNIDGSNAQLLHHCGSPADLAFDPVDQKIYFSSVGGIDRGNVDGSGFEQVVHLPAWEGAPGPEQIAIDAMGRKLYWIDVPAKLVQRSNLDGTAIEDFVTATEAGNPDMALSGLTVIQPLSIPAVSFGGWLGLSLLLIVAGAVIAMRRSSKQPTEWGSCLYCDTTTSSEPDYGNGMLEPGHQDVYTCENGTQNAYPSYFLGPRSEVNPWTGVGPIGAQATKCSASNVTDCRLQVNKLDLANYSGADFFIEQQVITPNESSSVRFNNVSHKTVTVGSCTTDGCGTSVCDVNRSCSNCQTSGTNCTYALTVSSTHNCEVPAIRAWKDDDSTVVETDINVSSDGMFILAAKAWNVEGCIWEYEYALYNMNSDRAADGFSVPLPNDLSSGELAEIKASAGFHDIAYHSGEIYDSTNWTLPTSALSSSIPWSIAANSNNALYWGTLYNFRFRAPRGPVYTGAAATVTVDLYRSGSPTTVTGVSVAPGVTTHSLGACCYGGDACMVTTECHCEDLSGVWTLGGSCLSCSMGPSP